MQKTLYKVIIRHEGKFLLLPDLVETQQEAEQVLAEKNILHDLVMIVEPMTVEIPE